MNISLKGKTALVTGASRGIGRAIAIALAGAGADIIFTYNSSPNDAEKTTAAIVANGQKAQAKKKWISRMKRLLPPFSKSLMKAILR